MLKTGQHDLQGVIDSGVESCLYQGDLQGSKRLLNYEGSFASPTFKVRDLKGAIELTFDRYFASVDVCYKYSLDFNIIDPVKLDYVNPFSKKGDSFYVLGFERYSYDMYFESIYSNDKHKNVSEEVLTSHIQTMQEFFQTLELRNSCLLLPRFYV